MNQTISKRYIAMLLVVALLLSFAPISGAKAAESGETNVAPEDSNVSTQGETGSENDSSASASPPVYRDGKIYIYNFGQLNLIGTNAVVTDSDAAPEQLGYGTPVLNENNSAVTYSSDREYFLVANVAFEDGKIWAPENVDSLIISGAKDDASALYDEDTDTIYIQNVYQLETLASAARASAPVMTGDSSAETFGMGQFIYPNDSDAFLTYSKDHHYVLSSTFTTDRPERMADQAKLLAGPRRAPSATGNTSLIDGRDYFGQPVVEIDGTKYILIGSRQQLEAINSDSSTTVFGPVYKVEQTRARITDDWGSQSETATLIYPGDADLISGVDVGDHVEDFSDNVMYSGNNGILSSDTYHSLTTVLDIVGRSRTVYCTVDADGKYSISERSNPYSTLTYSKSGNYIVFRDIDLRNETWQPLMFTGTMYGAKAQSRSDVSTLWNADKTQINIDTANKPIISNINVQPATLQQLGLTRLDLGKQTGVGFFGTLSGRFNSSSIIEDPCVVQNIKLLNGTVNNPTTKADIDVTLVNGLLVSLSTLLGTVLDPVLKLLIGKDVGLKDMLTGLLNARAKDPSSLATGAFAGRIIGNVSVQDCEVENIGVTTVKTEYEDSNLIVGKGGFVGYVEGETKYDALSNALGTVGSALSSVLNIIPGVGLGDLVTVLLDNALPLKDLIPTGYVVPKITGCKVNNGTLSDEAGKFGVGGFSGSVCGTVIENCTVENSTMTIKADHFGGGFVGVERDAIIKGTLSGLGIDVAASLHPQSEIINSSISNSNITVNGGTYLGGFAGVQANSYCINDTVTADSTLNVDGTGDFVGGFTGYAMLGTLFGLGDYLESGNSLLGTVKGLVTGLLGNGSDQSLLDLGGVAPSAIMGCQIAGNLSVASDGSYVGGLVGRGNGVYIISSSPDNISLLAKYKRGSVDLPAVQARENFVQQLESVHAGGNFAGGLAGYLTSANVGGLLGDTLGVGQYLGFTVSDTTIQGVSDGYSVDATSDYAGGGVGWAVGGDVKDIELLSLRSVVANNRAGGLVGATGPGDLVNGNGLDLQLLGISLISIDNLLSLVSGVRTTYMRANVTGIQDGFEVEELGLRENGDQTIYSAGGYAAEANSVTIDDCHVNALKSVKANMNDGVSGGFVGTSSAGGLAGVVEEGKSLSVAQVGQLVNAVPYLVPSYNGCDVTYVNGGYVQGDAAGGYAGDFQSGKVNTGTLSDAGTAATYESSRAYTVGVPGTPYAVNNLHHVRGGHYAGGFGGKVYSGALVSAGGGLSVLGGATNVSLSASDLLGLAEVYVPVIKYGGVNTPSGFSVLAANIPENEGDPSDAGYAGGFIGYGSGVQVSYSDVNKLKHGTITEPDELEGTDGSAYMMYDADHIPYAVAGARYAGGYIGYMDVGSAASVGGGLKLLGKSISLTNVLDVLSVVVSTVEHSNVYGCPGGFAVLASSHAALGDGEYDNLGVGYAGGFAGKISGGHIQDSNVNLFSYIIGEVAAGGYVGEVEPGSAASILKDESSLSLLGEVNSLASLVEDFVPSIRNSETTCIPCGGAVRAQTPSDDSSNQGSVKRGMAGGYVGHAVGLQLLGNSDATWKSENDAIGANGETVYWDSIEKTKPNYTIGHYVGPKRECAAIRIRSVYGAEHAGGFVGLVECGSTAQTGGLSLLGGLISAQNLLGALNAVYPVFRSCAVYGPLEKMDYQTWNLWATYVGSHGGFASELAQIGTVSSQEELDAILPQFIYGTAVVAGRTEYDGWATTLLSGTAGGFVGSMHSGVFHDCFAYDTMRVNAMRAAGGFAGEMQTKGLAEFGSVGLLGLDLNLGGLLKVGSVFVPAIYHSGTTGYQRGVSIKANGDASKPGVGMAGGYVGASYGGQIDDAWIRNLRMVKGTNSIGGFVGLSSAASILSADTGNASSGFLQKLLDSVISNPSKLVDVLNASVATIKNAEVSSADPEWGFVVDGSYMGNGGTKYANFAGGFAGKLEATVVGERKNAEDEINVRGLRGVIGGYYAGGFFGLGDVGSVAQVGGDDGTGSSTNILSLIQAGNVSLLDAFRAYVYHAHVYGVDDGFTVFAMNQASTGARSTYQVSGAAGGFGGGLMNGTTENSTVSNLNYVKAPNYAGGFIGVMGKNGGVSVDEVKVTNNSLIGQILSGLGLDLGANAQLLNLVGSTVKNCDVSGFDDGFIVETTETQVRIPDVVDTADLTGACAAGFTGYADISQIDNCTVGAFKYAKSEQVAAGFIGRSTVAYLADVDASSDLTGAVVKIVNGLIKFLYLNDLQNVDLIDLDANILGLKLLSDGDLLYVNLLGLKVGVSLSKNDPEYGGSDAAVITLGSSVTKLPCDEDGLKGETPDITVNLIEGNRTSVKGSTVTGIDTGYDIYAGGADSKHDGSDALGYAGGFVGYNDSGFFSRDTMVLCDVIRGTANKIGPFAGHTNPRSRPLSYLEGTGNQYSVYRSLDEGYTSAKTSGGTTFGTAQEDNSTSTAYNRYDVAHLNVIQGHDTLKDAVESGTGTRPLDAYVSAGKEVLMLGVESNPNSMGDTPEPGELKDPCEEEFVLTIKKVWKDLKILENRPDSITVYVTRIEAGTTPPEHMVEYRTPNAGENQQTYKLILTANDKEDWSDAWSKELSNLPVAVEKDVDGETVVVYYKYLVYEVQVSGYETTAVVDDATATVTITNTYRALLPFLGGNGTGWYVTAGLALTIVGAYLLHKQKRRKEGRAENAQPSS